MKVSIQQIIEALEATGGWQSQAAEKLGINHSSLSRRIKRHQVLQQALEDIRCKYLDLAESQLIKAIKEGNLSAIIFYLKCQGKKRGYVERAEVTGAEGAPVNYVQYVRLPEKAKSREEWVEMVKRDQAEEAQRGLEN